MLIYSADLIFTNIKKNKLGEDYMALFKMVTNKQLQTVTRQFHI